MYDINSKDTDNYSQLQVTLRLSTMRKKTTEKIVGFNMSRHEKRETIQTRNKRFHL